jgi:putative NADH-flavin reductase
MKIALFGAAGRTGRRVLDECISRGFTVAALARDAAGLPARPGVAVTQGDARDAAAVAKVVAGTDAVVCCLGMHDITVPATDFSDSVKTIVAAARRAGVRRIVAIASAGVLRHPAGGLRNQHGLPAYLVNVAPEHTRNYETLRDSGLDWTLMCPVDLKDDIPGGHARMAYDDLPSGSFETGYADLAHAIVELVDQPASFGKRVGIVSDRP